MNKKQDLAFARLEDALVWIKENAEFRANHLAVEQEVMALRAENADLKAIIQSSESEAVARRAEEGRAKAEGKHKEKPVEAVATEIKVPPDIEQAAFSVFGSVPVMTLVEWCGLYHHKIILAALAEVERADKPKRRPAYAAAILQRWAKEGKADPKALMHVEQDQKAKSSLLRCPGCGREKQWTMGGSMECFVCGSRYVEAGA